MIIWNGMGILVLILGFGSLLGTEFVVEKIFNDDQLYQEGWPKLVGFIVAGLLIGPIGMYLNKKPEKVLYDPETNESVVIRNNHSFFFIPMQYWGAILWVLGVIIFFKEA